MSTFDGIVSEFPEIQIDYFRQNPNRPAPLACFLSHVHSDHLQGLESFRAPFIYCSPATRERPIPLNTPTDIELTPKKHVRVTLFDANHCVGAVMFLIEGSGNAVLYTGDIRAEKWWTDALIRHPLLIPYTLGKKRLDKVYLDTTFATKSNPLREFPSKAEGLSELLTKVEAYPAETIFYFRAWTFGYEDVWLALSAALNAKVHLDRYQLGLYRALMSTSGGKEINEAHALCGFELGNRSVAGCLSDDDASRIHSCEPGVSCKAARGPKTVYITPIVNRTREGDEIPEAGAGGGAGDLYQAHELELPDESALARLEELCARHIHDPEALSKTRTALLEAFRSRKRTLSLDRYDVHDDEIPLEQLVTKLSHRSGDNKDTKTDSDLPNTINFPYSRHSSYSELCHLIAALKPKDVHPCTVDPSSWSESVSIRYLFGHLCSGEKFSHDDHMHDILDAQYDEEHHARKRVRYNNHDGNGNENGNENDIDDDLATQSSQRSSMPEEPTLNTNRTPLAQYPVATTISDRAATRHSEIQKAHRYLHEIADSDLLQIGPLPSSFPTEKVNASFVSNTTSNGHTDQDTTTSQDLPLIPTDTNEQQQSQSPLNESQITDTLTLSITKSTLAPSSPVDADAALMASDSDSDSSPEISPNGTQGSKIRRSAGRRRVMARLRGRVSAYLAASDGSYSAWEEHSLVSAGDNHAEETEL
ncbi:hypothetical protein N7478_004189 [Penicillium angulare]|uniref:uncharacterized protein n=1 Tax=Penicillium angulare TaxID=116970 RepID=UPI0025416CAE|nr:uncharacterized protein N7478_004189 [Penicillium angulare]KAJ5278817.1 hypothetical protein N7478_004189 [Penicillium angulare]